MSQDDFAFEPVPGLPALPPEGETILWQGGPDWRGLAWRAFHLREVTCYFGALVAAQPVLALVQGTPLAATLLPMTWLTLAGSVAAGLLAGLAFLAARGTVYTITSRRLVLRFGIALPMTINLPFALVAQAGLKLRRGGSGDIPVGLVPGERISYIVLWPHARPWRLARWLQQHKPLLLAATRRRRQLDHRVDRDRHVDALVARQLHEVGNEDADDRLRQTRPSGYRLHF